MVRSVVVSAATEFILGHARKRACDAQSITPVDPATQSRGAYAAESHLDSHLRKLSSLKYTGRGAAKMTPYGEVVGQLQPVTSTSIHAQRFRHGLPSNTIVDALIDLREPSRRTLIEAMRAVGQGVSCAVLTITTCV